MIEENPAHPLNDRQRLQIDEYESIVEVMGQFDQTTGANGAHYAPADANPFQAEGLICSNCVFFEGSRACELVAGDIDPNAVCKMWVIPEDLIAAPVTASGERPTVSLTFSQPITAANSETRTITGQIVPWDQVGYASLGAVIFERGSITIPERVKVLQEHDNRKPVGFMANATETATGITAELKIAGTSRGNDLLIEAASGLRDGISVGVDLVDHTVKDGAIYVTSAILREVSLVESPAFDAARVTKVAASEHAQEPEEASPMSEQPIEETVVEVEAAKVEASYSPIMTAPRINPNMTAGEVLGHQLKAMNGDSESRQITAALAVDTTTDDAGLIPNRYMNNILGLVNGSRPTIDSISRGAMPDGGKKFYYPRWVTLPSVGVTAEGVQPSSTGTAIDNLEVSKVKFAGANQITWEDLDLTSPSYLDAFLSALGAQMARAQDAYAYAAIADAAVTTTGASLWDAIAQAQGDSFDNRLAQPDRLLTSSAQWSNVLGATDNTGRPLYAASNPMNNGGDVRNIFAGTFMGLSLAVEPAAGSSDLIVMPSDAAVWFESPQVQVRANVIAGGAVEIGVYSYGAIAITYPDAIRAAAID